MKKYIKILLFVILCLNTLLLSGCDGEDEEIGFKQGIEVTANGIEYVLAEDISENIFYECVIRDNSIIAEKNNYYINQDPDDPLYYHVWELVPQSAGITQICFYNGVTIDTGKLFNIEVTEDVNGKLECRLLEDNSREVMLTPVGNKVIIEMEEFVFDGNILFNFISDENVLELTDDDLIYDDNGATHHWEFTAKGKGDASIGFSYGMTKDEAKKNPRIAEYRFTVDENMNVTVN